MKNIILHGSTNSTNFGDFIFADMIYDFIIQDKENNKVDFIKLSPFFKRNLNIGNKKIKIKEADQFIYIPGHYFIIKENEGFKQKLWRLKEFIIQGVIATAMNKKVAIIDIGVGPFRNSLLSQPVKYICNNASLITVRDSESKEYLIEIGVKNKVLQTTDLVLSFNKKLIKEPNKKFTEKIEDIIPNSKKIFIHYNSSKKGMKKFAYGIKEFLKKNPEYGLIVGSDSIVEDEVELYEEFKSIINNDRVILHKYEDPWELCGVLDLCEMVITTKLHVGIVGLRLEKSVLSFPIHYEKTKRLYEQIGESDRCISLDEVKEQQIDKLIEKYHNKNIPLNPTIFNSSNKNWKLLNDFLEM